MNIRKEYSSSQDLPFSVPQGSCVGAQLFNLYCSSIQDIVGPPLTLQVLQMIIQLEIKLSLETVVTKQDVWMNWRSVQLI